MFPEEEKKEKERAIRRAEMRQKVAALLPDFAATSLKSSRDMSWFFFFKLTGKNIMICLYFCHILQLCTICYNKNIY